MAKLSIYDMKKGDKFRVKSNDCHISKVEFVSQGAAGAYEKNAGNITLKPGDIIEFDHVAYLGSDPGPGVPWFIKPGEGRGEFWPNDWGSIHDEHLEPILEDKYFLTNVSRRHTGTIIVKAKNEKEVKEKVRQWGLDAHIEGIENAMELQPAPSTLQVEDDILEISEELIEEYPNI
ncbi:MAG: hypothetical protein ACOCRO_02320 [Halanaerobiales bacterium]